MNKEVFSQLSNIDIYTHFLALALALVVPLTLLLNVHLVAPFAYLLRCSAQYHGTVLSLSCTLTPPQTLVTCCSALASFPTNPLDRLDAQARAQETVQDGQFKLLASQKRARKTSDMVGETFPLKLLLGTPFQWLSHVYFHWSTCAHAHKENSRPASKDMRRPQTSQPVFQHKI